MANKVAWLRISFWAGAIGDFVIAILVLIPERMGVPSYVYPMGLMSAVAFSWGCMLIWADRDPIQRRWVLLPTILVGAGHMELAQKIRNLADIAPVVRQVMGLV